MRFKGPSGLALFFIFFFVLIIILSLGYNPQARLIPLVIAIPGLLLTIGQWVGALYKERKVEREEKSLAAEDREELSREKNTMAWIIIFFLMIVFLGLHASILLFTFIYLKFKSKESWPLSLSITGGLWLGIYLAFVQIVKASLYPGLLWKLFE